MHNLPYAEYRRFEGIREYEELIDGLIPQTQRVIRVFDRTLSLAWNSPQRAARAENAPSVSGRDGRVNSTWLLGSVR